MNSIKEFRTKLKLTQTQLAEILGVSFVTVNRWENGHTKPSKLAKARLKELQENGIKDGSKLVHELEFYGTGDEALVEPSVDMANGYWGIINDTRKSFRMD